MSNYHEWDGTEEGLYQLLIWWGICIPWEHSEGCEGNSLHCCEGVSEFVSNASIEASTCAFHDPVCIFNIDFSDGTSPMQPVEIGDRIYYRERGKFELVKKPDPMPEYNNAKRAFVINGRGVAVADPNAEWRLPEGYWEPWDLTGRMAKINGHEVKIRGVEAFCSMRSPDNPYRHSLCFLLSEEDAERVVP